MANVNYASLVLSAETSGLLKGKKALEETTRAGANTDKAIRGLDGRFKKTGDSAGTAAPKVERFSQATDATRSVALMATRALTGMAAGYASFAAAGASINMARDFNAALAETSTLIEGTPEQLDALTEASRSMAREFGGSSTDQVKAFYQAISAGADGVEGATQLLDQANKLAIGGITDVTTGVDALTTAMNAYGPDVLSAAEASDAMFVAMRAGKTTIGELSGSLGQIVPIASSAGVSFDEVTAGIAALTTQGLSTASATTGLRQVLASVIAPTKQATDAATALGVSFDVQALKSKGLAEFLDDVITKTGGNEAAMAQLFGSVEALGAALAFAGGAGGTFTDILADMEIKAGATDAAYLKMSESLDQRWNKLTAAATDIALGFGNALLAVVVPAMEGIAAASVAVGQNLDIVLVSLSALAATQIPAAVAGLVTLTAGMSASAVATGVFTTAVNIARGAVIALGGPLGVVWGILGAGAAAWAVWGRGANEGETAAYDAAAGTSALLGQLDEFYKTTAPNAAAKAIDMANANYKLAASAFEAAKGELAKRRAMLDMAASSGANGTSGSIRDMGSSATYEAPKYQAALAKMEAAEAALEQAMRDRKVTANAVTGSVSEVMSATVAASQTTNDHSITLDINSGSLGKNAKAAGGASKALKDAAKSAKDMADEIERLEFDADPLKKYNAELADLDTLVANGLSDGAYRKAVDDLNEGLAAGIPMVDDLANAFGDFIGSGLSDFKGFAKSILNSFTSMISQMVATAARNRILIGLGFSGGGVASQAAAGLTGGAAPGGGIFGSLGSGGGLLGSIGGTVGALTSGIGAGFNMALGGLTSGGLSGLGSVLSTQLGAATASVGAFGAALGAIALPLAGVAAVFSFFKKSVKELDAGLRITVDGMDALVESFRKTETKRFWGLSKKVRTSYTELEEEAAAPIISTIESLANSVIEMGDVFGFAASNIDRASVSLKISTKGLSDAEIEEAITEEMNRLADVFADSMVGSFSGMVTTFEEYQSPIMKLLNIPARIKESTGYVDQVNEEFEALKKAGEGSYETLERLVSRLTGVNASFDMLGFSLYDLSLAGAGAASSFVDLFGTLDDFNSITGSYYENFYSDAERIAKATQLVTDSLLDLGIDGLPATRRAFRELVEETEALGDDELLASLLKLSPAFAEITAATDALAASANALITEDAFATGFDYARSLAQAQNNIAYQPPAVSNAFGSVPRAQQDMTAELRGIRADLTLLQSTMQITAANTGRAADAADDTLAVTLENAL
ncbi:phage tail tape measure protein [Sulfitobacter sp. PM12]|uniref:phage tail tape measure protein n=1 Tax=Sulfitobacter sp. PM12 TaxID=3138497 RepID=UPI00388E7BD4